MSSQSLQVNTLNVFLIIVSLAVAYRFPFELFLLAYAILGPLHYVTEINWLEKKNYFIQEKRQILLLVLLTALIAIPYALTAYAQTKDAAEANVIIKFLRAHSSTLPLVGLATAFSLVFTKDWRIILLTFFGAFALGLVFEGKFAYTILLGGMIPTIIHVYIFTILFMLYGAFKDKSQVGYISVILMLVVPVVIIYLPINPRGYIDLGTYFVESFDASRFVTINYSLGYMLGLTSENMDYAVMSEIGIKIQVFIAFAYTYHYLNWFSKTTVIGWHKVISKKRLVVLLAIWIVSVGFYYYNYYAGFLVLLFLSYLHVLLEFPLNWVSIKEIGRHVFGRAK